MRSFNFVGFAVISVLCCCSFLPAQGKVQYQEFVDAQIIPNDALSIADIKALPKAVGNSIETLDNGAVLVQIPADEIQPLADKGAQIKSVRNFLLVTPAGNQINALAGSSYEYGENDDDVDIPSDGSFTGSGIDFTSAPANIITSVDVHYEIESSWTGYVYAELSDYPETRTYSLVDGVNGSINQTKTGITTFNGISLNTTWVLWAREEYSSGDGFIDYWWIKLYYDTGSDYCSATTTYTDYEYISSVLVGSINNPTGSSGYADYTGLSTTMNIGTGYPITVNNGEPYSTDGCGIWVDWNQDKDFDDAGETITVSGTPGTGPYTATITPPSSALTGNTRMRVRIVDTGYNNLLPCGTASYGEVEDYTINVSASQPTLKVSGHITLLGNGSPLAGALLEVYSGGTPTGLTDISDSNGYYDINVPSPWTGFVDAQKQGYVFSEHQTFTNVTTNQVQDFNAHYAYSGGIGTESSPYLIATAEDMNSIGGHPEDWGRQFRMIADVDLSDYTGTEFKIIGSAGNPFTGVFDGNQNAIWNFTYKKSDGQRIALFAYADSNCVIKNLTFYEPNINGGNYVAVLVGTLYNGRISNCHVISGNVCGDNIVAGLVGWCESGEIEYCSCEADVNGGNGDFTGGLVAVSDGNISKCFAAGRVYGFVGVGGLIGSSHSGTVSDCYAIGSVTGHHCVGGLIGSTDMDLKVYRSYAAGLLSGVSDTGGFSGIDSGASYTKCFWDNDINPDVNGIGNSSDPNVIGLPTEQMQMESTFTLVGWDFTTPLWKICEGTNYPKLAWQIPLAGDFGCPDGVDFADFTVLAKQWMLEKLSCDLNNDGIIDFSDFAAFAENWQGDLSSLFDFSSQWLQSSAYNADIAPEPAGDGIVDIQDFAVFADNWLKGDNGDGYVQWLNVQPCNMNLSQLNMNSNSTRFSITVQGNKLYFEDLIQANCCKDEIRLNVTVEGGYVAIHEIEETANPCLCLCDFPTTALLGPFADGDYIVEVFGVSGNSLGTVEVTIPSQ